MLDRFSKSWELGKTAASVLRADKELILYPIISSLVIAFINLAFILQLSFETLDETFWNSIGLNGFFLLVAILLISQYFVINYFRFALVGAALIRIRGGDPTLRDGINVANSRFTPIISYTIICGTVGLFLGVIERIFRIRLLSFLEYRPGIFISSIIQERLIGSKLGLPWGLSTLLLIPVVIDLDQNPTKAIKTSINLIANKWGTKIRQDIHIGLVFNYIFLALIAIIIVTAGLLPESTYLPIGSTLIIILCVLLPIARWVIGSPLGGIFAAAVYNDLTAEKTSGFFSEEIIENCFKPVKTKKRMADESINLNEDEVLGSGHHKGESKTNLH